MWVRQILIPVLHYSKGKRAFIDAIHDIVEVHGTVENTNGLNHVPPYVVNHGVLPGNELHALLRRSKVC